MKSLVLQIIPILFIGFFLKGMVNAQIIHSEKFQRDASAFFRETVKTLDIPGFAVTAVYDNTTLLADGFGYADLEHKVKAGSGSGYYIASVTKSFMALTAVILDVEGIIKLDDPISKYFPEVDFHNTLDISKVKISMRMLFVIVVQQHRG